MKKVKKCFWFLGSIQFAISIITFTTLLVITGTFLEAFSNSHLFASYWTYDSPLLSLLFSLFFLNILISALRRWPFKWKHVPFLITHLGLLMIITGCVIKQWYGLQGNMMITEGNSSKGVQIPYSYALGIEKRHPFSSKPIHSQQVISTNENSIYKNLDFPELQFKLLHFIPHSQNKMETWIKGDYAFFYGISPMKVQESGKTKEAIHFQPIHLSDKIKEWQMATIKTENVPEAILEAYRSLFTITIKDKDSGSTLKLNLNEFTHPISFADGSVTLKLETSWFEEKLSSFLTFDWKSSHNNSAETVQVPLSGSQALDPILILDSSFNRPRFDIDLHTEFPIVLLIDHSSGALFFILDQQGRIHHELFPTESPRSIVSYDKGFGGYTIQKQIPSSPFFLSKEEVENEKKKLLINEIQLATESKAELIPPLELLKKTCEKENINFSQTFVDLLHAWEKDYHFLLSKNSSISKELTQVISKIDWDSISKNDLNACHWISLLFSRLEAARNQGENLIQYLKNNNWPLIKELEQQSKQKEFNLLIHLAKQMYQFAPELPPLTQQEISLNENSETLLTAYLKAFGIDYKTFISELENKHGSFTDTSKKTNDFRFETPFTVKHLPISSLLKVENNCPCIVIEAKKNKIKQIISLSYDGSSSSLKWPILNGEYLLRFQPKAVEIPFSIRLKQARQIPYAGSSQIYSYEANILISETDTKSVEKILSMNHVHETWNGYRFYLSGITTLESGLKRVQLAVNYDPAKYVLTYPGGLLVALGIILLFWLKPYSKHKDTNLTKIKQPPQRH